MSNENNDVEDLSDLLIYPNPTKDNINIKLDKEKRISSIELYNIKGQKIKRFSISLKTKELKLSTQDLNLSNGLYFFKINADSEYKISKFLYYK